MPTIQNLRHRLSFEIKSTSLPLIALHLKSTDLRRLSDDFAHRFGDMPEFFDEDGIVIDLSHLQTPDISLHSPGFETPLDFSVLKSMLHNYRLRPLAVRGGNARQIAAAMAAGLVHAPDQLPPRSDTSAPVKATPIQQPARSVLPSMPTGALVIDKPLRCGQQVYARGRDLIVMAMVNAGAEIIADGHIHVYAPLRGKAIAGAQGNTDARIFAMSLDSEMVAIAGIYETGDRPAYQGGHGHPAQVSLLSGPDGDRLIVDRIQG
jgi:septum site-determining protein MinC